MWTSRGVVLRTLSLWILGSAAIATSQLAAQSELAKLGAGAAIGHDSAPDTVRTRPPTRSGEKLVSLSVRNVPLKEVLRAIANQSGIALYYNDGDIPADAQVTIVVTDVSAADAIRRALDGTDMRARTTPAGIVIEATRRRNVPTQAVDTTGSISGSVTDSTTGEPIGGATIALRGASRGATSGDDGRFRIAELGPGTYTVLVRRLGYRQESRNIVVPAGGNASLTFMLVPAPRMLDQTVTTATGYQRRGQVGNLIATISADSLVATAPVTTLAQLLAGRVAGVQVQFGGGLTGTSPPISIRGQNSLSLSNQPLLVVDGVRVANTTTSGVTAPTAAGVSSGRFNDIEPSEIESIQIVKGPSAATLYGTDAANGVILIQTKRGEIGAPRWSVFAEGGALTFDRNRFSVSYFPWGHRLSGSADPVRCPLLGVAAGTCLQDSVTSFSPLRNAETTPIGSGSRHKVGLQVRGGSTVQYLLSATQEGETGYLKMPSADRTLLEEQAGRSLTSEELHPNGISKYSVRGNFTVPLTRALDIDVSTAFTHANLRIPNPTALYFGGLSTGVRDQNDGWTRGLRAGEYMIKRDHERLSHITGGVSARWRPNSWLTGRLTTGLDFSSDYFDRLAPPGLGFSGVILGSRENTKVNIALQTVDAGVSVTLPISGFLTSRTSVGAQYNRSAAYTNTAGARTLVPGAQTVAGGAVPLVSESTVQGVVAGSYIEETLGWRDRLYITGAARVDGASSFGAGFRTAIYPKASLSWLISEEQFWPHIPGVSSLRLRTAYGESGVQPGPIASLQTEALFAVSVDGSATTGARLGALGNRDLRPERQKEFEGGLDLELLDGRIGIQATYYDKRSEDALVSVALPASYGGGAQWQNVGAVRNRGYEALVNASLLATPRVNWSLTMSGSINDNTILALAPSIDAMYRAGTALPGLVRGYPLKSYFDYPIESVSDANGDGIITPSEVVVGDEPEFNGRGFPRTQLSGTTRLGLIGNRLTIGATLEYRGGYTILNGAESVRCLFNACSATTLRNVDLSGQAANVTLVTAALHNSFWGYLEDGSFTRLREISLTYSLPRAISSRMGVNTASVTLSGRNLALWSAYGGTDPEVQSLPGNSDAPAAYDTTVPPVPKYWLVRINVGF